MRFGWFVYAGQGVLCVHAAHSVMLVQFIGKRFCIAGVLLTIVGLTVRLVLAGSNQLDPGHTALIYFSFCFEWVLCKFAGLFFVSFIK